MNYKQVVIHPQASIAKNATIIGEVEIGKDVTVLSGATLRGDGGAHITIGEGSNIQELCCLHLSTSYNCIIGRGVTVGHGCIVHGCTIGDNSLIGMGAIILNGAIIGKNCIVAAGAVVTQNMQIPDNTMVMGIPAKAKRECSLKDIADNKENAEKYVAIGKDLIENNIAYAGCAIPHDIPTIAIK